MPRISHTDIALPPPRRGSHHHILTLALAIALGCGRDRADDRTVDGAAPVAAADSAPAPTASADTTTCAETGLWRECSLVKRLERTGLIPVRRGEVAHPLFSVRGIRYGLGDEELQVFLYGSATERERDLRGIDTVRVARPGSPAEWPAPPTLITSNNLAAVLLGGSPRQVERVTNTIRAGLPR